MLYFSPNHDHFLTITSYCSWLNQCVRMTSSLMWKYALESFLTPAACCAGGGMVRYGVVWYRTPIWIKLTVWTNNLYDGISWMTWMNAKILVFMQFDNIVMNIISDNWFYTLELFTFYHFWWSSPLLKNYTKFGDKLGVYSPWAAFQGWSLADYFLLSPTQHTHFSLFIITLTSVVDELFHLEVRSVQIAFQMVQIYEINLAITPYVVYSLLVLDCSGGSTSSAGPIEENK